MPRVVVGTTPIQLAWSNPRRKKWEAEFLPASIIAGNTGKVYIKRGSAPVASDTSNTWDHVLNSGAAVGDNIDDSSPESPWKGAIYAVSDTADQVLTFLETEIEQK